MTEGKGAVNGPKSKRLAISRPSRRNDLFLELLLRNFLLARNEQREVRSSTTEQLIGEGVEGQSQDGIILGQLQNRFYLLLGLNVELPQDACPIIPGYIHTYDAVAKVLPSLAKAMALMGSLAEYKSLYLHG